MIITTVEEIKAYVPTSVYQRADALLTLTQDAEETYLLPVLGRTLYNRVSDAYREIVEGGSNPLPSNAPGNTDEDPQVTLIRLCQMPVIYFTLANNTGILSISLNGGGINQMSTEGYDAADDKAVARFTKDAFMKAHRGIDRLLLFLEEDATSDTPLFADDWHESRYFYLQGDLLFTTATAMNRFLDIKDSREEFISLLPDIRYCQDVYLAPRVGEDLLDALVRWCSDPKAVLAEAFPPTGAADEVNGTALTAIRYDHINKAWRNAVDRLRMALALFIENRRPEKQRRYSENDAMMSLARAADYIAASQFAFGELMEGSPLYVLPAPAPDMSSVVPCKPAFNYDDPTNAVFVPFGAGLNRF